VEPKGKIVRAPEDVMDRRPWTHPQKRPRRLGCSEKGGFDRLQQRPGCRPPVFALLAPLPDPGTKGNRSPAVRVQPGR